MRCCVPFCKNTLDNVSQGEWKAISFHGFPSEVHLRAAWLRALGKQDSHLPDSAVVCSQHFLDEDIYETESGVRQISTGAIPSTVQVCMICLDTDSKMLLLSKHKLDEAYEKLTGYPLCDLGNLKQTLCIQCARRLIYFSRFRDKTLRARSLMMDLVGKHELITKRHVKMINRTKHQLNSNIVLTTLGPDHCDLHILEHPSEDKQTEFEETGNRVIVKTEESDHSFSVIDMEMKNEDSSNIYDFVQEKLEYEGALFQCTFCLEEFLHEHACMQHILSMHLQDGDGDGECDTSQVCRPHTAVSSSSSHSSLITGNKLADPSPTEHAVTTLGEILHDNDIKVPPIEEVDTNVGCRYERLTDCFVQLYDIFTQKVVPRQDKLLMETSRTVWSCDSPNIAPKDISYPATSQNEVPTTEYIHPVTDEDKVTVSNTLYICDFCQKLFKQRSLLVKHIKNHMLVNRFTCKICQYKCSYKSKLIDHMRTHAGEKPFPCKLCSYKCAKNSTLAKHMKTHTGEKPFPCKLCSYKCARYSALVKHMTTHTGEKPFTCKLCSYKFARNSTLVMHMKTHTGEKPFPCKLCSYKCARNNTLVRHMKVHTDEKSFPCKLCSYKFTRNSSLVKHMRTHTGEKPFSCKLCSYKCARNSVLVKHMKTHTDEKVYLCTFCDYKCALNCTLVRHMKITHEVEKSFACKLCSYKCKRNSSLVMHMKTHTGEKPYLCTICDYKFSSNRTLLSHMRTHTGIKPYLCKFCNHRFALKCTLMRHMRIHTGEKPYSCTLCNYKTALRVSLVCHMRTHTGIKPYTCKFCKYKSAENSNLVRHMRIHTGEKPHHCKLCDYKCESNFRLMRHMKIHLK